MSVRTDPTRRLMRGEVLRPDRYWSSFITLSIAVHLVMLAGLSGVAESFIKSLPRPLPPKPPVIYVSLLFQPPTQLGEVKVLPKATVKPKMAKAPDRKPTSKAEHRQAAVPHSKAPESKPVSPMEAKPAETRKVARADVTAPVKRQATPAKKKPAVKKATGAQHKVEETHASPDPVPDVEAGKVAGIKYRRFFEPSDDSVVLIKGSEITEVKPGRPEPKKPPAPEPALKPEDDKPKAVPEVSPPEPEELKAYDVAGYESPRMPELAEPFAGVFELPEPLTARSVPGAMPVVMLGARQARPDEVAPRGPVVLATAGREVPLPEAPDQVYAAYRGDYIPVMRDAVNLAAFMLVKNDPFALLRSMTETSEAPPLETHSVREAPTLASSEPKEPEPKPEPVFSPKIIVVEDFQEEPAAPPEVRITSPTPGPTGRGLVDVEGTATGDGVNSVLFWEGGRKLELLVREGTFTRPVSLEAGRNVLSAVAMDSEGRTSRDRVVVYFEPGSEGPDISFERPANGAVIDALVSRNITIAGTVSGDGAKTVRLYLNRSIIEAPVEGGRFRYQASIEAESNTLFAEATGAGGSTSRTETVKFTAINLRPKDLTVRIETDGATPDVSLVKDWRPHPLSEEVSRFRPEFTESRFPGGVIAAVEEAADGIYTVSLRYDIPPGESRKASFLVTVHGYDEARKQTRTIGPFTLSGTGYLPAVRLLMPERVFWEDDYWFSGVVESGSGTMKFNSSKGISWTEKD